MISFPPSLLVARPLLGPLLQIVSIYGATWVGWKLLRKLFSTSPLDNLPGPPGGSWSQGHFDQLWSYTGWAFHKELAEKYGPVSKLRGPFGKTIMYVYDPKALHHIIVKDQQIFEETPGFLIGMDVTFGKGLFSTTGEAHRRQRKMMNPVFSIGHMRGLIPIFYNVSHKASALSATLRDTFLQKMENGPQEVDMEDWLTRTALELVGQSGLGFSFDPLTEGGEQHHYSHSVKNFIPVGDKLMIARHFVLPLVYNFGTPRFRRWVVDTLPWKNLHELRDIVDAMQDTAVEIVESKQRAIKAGDEAILQQIGKGNDIISILIKENMKASEEDRLPDEELVGQVSSLTFAAMDTTSNALCRTLYVLCERPDAQDRLRAEIRAARRKVGGGELGYDELVSLPYLDAVCRETLRLYPPVSTIMREAREDIVLPFSKPIRGKDGSEMHEVLVPKGTTVFPSILSSNRNTDVWGSDSDEWKPERWMDGLPDSVVEAHIPGIYSHLMTFIGGSRACIGFKFSQLEMKIVLCVLLDKFKFNLPNDRKIFWRMTGIASPSIEGGSKAEMPLIVSLAD